MADIKVTIKKDTGVNITSRTDVPVIVEQKIIDILHSNHALLKNLEFEKSGHIGFQKQLEYDEDLKCYLVET